MTNSVYEALFRSQPQEHARASLSIRGALPPELRGTFFRASPGLLQIGADTVNFFDGHALITGVSLDGGKAHLRSRFVATPVRRAELAAGRMMARRVFTNLPRRRANFLRLALGNTAMHDVYAWGGKVFAGCEPGHYALDAGTLETLGLHPWDGKVKKGEEVGAMPYADPHTGRLVVWTKRAGGSRPDQARFLEVDPQGRVVHESAPVPLSGSPAFLHDQRATKRWYVAPISAFKLSPLAALWGVRTVWSCLSMPADRTTDVLIVPREGPPRAVRVPLPKSIRIAFHVINAYDEGDRVVVDLVTYDGPICFEGSSSADHRTTHKIERFHSARPTAMRFVIDPIRATLIEDRILSELPVEAPEIRDDRMGQPYRYVYAPTLGNDADTVPDRGGYLFFGALTKIDTQTGEHTRWDAGADALVSPPAFVARPGSTEEDDGWLLAYVLREAGTELAVLDARDLSAGPIATVELGIHLPGTSHARWASGLQLTA